MAIEVQDAVEETLTEVESEDFRNLLVIGRMSSTEDIAGHSISLRTLSTNEDLAVGLYTKTYRDSDSYPRAYKTAIVAAAVREIDGELMPSGLSSDDTDLEILQAKIKKVARYYPAVIDEIYNRFIKLEQKLIPVVSRLGKTSN